MPMITFDQLADYVTEGGQREIDLCGFLQTIASGLGFALTFRTGKIDQIELSSGYALLSLVIFFTSFYVNCENGVTPRRVLIHSSLTRLPIGVTTLHILFNLLDRFNDAGCQIFHIHTFVLIFFQVEFVVDIFS